MLFMLCSCWKSLYRGVTISCLYLWYGWNFIEIDSIGYLDLFVHVDHFFDDNPFNIWCVELTLGCSGPGRQSRRIPTLNFTTTLFIYDFWEGGGGISGCICLWIGCWVVAVWQFVYEDLTICTENVYIAHLPVTFLLSPHRQSTQAGQFSCTVNWHVANKMTTMLINKSIQHNWSTRCRIKRPLRNPEGLFNITIKWSTITDLMIQIPPQYKLDYWSLFVERLAYRNVFIGLY